LRPARAALKGGATGLFRSLESLALHRGRKALTRQSRPLGRLSPTSEWHARVLPAGQIYDVPTIDKVVGGSHGQCFFWPWAFLFPMLWNDIAETILG
jgi:hypothetical protein